MEEQKYNEMKEKANHGDYMLPFAKYRTRIPKNFTSYPMHWHEEMEIIFVKDGSYVVNIDLNQMVIKGGSIIVVPPKLLHSFKQDGDNNMMSYTVLFHMRMLENLIPDVCMVNYFGPFLNGKLSFPKVITPDMDGYELIQSCVDRIFETYDNNNQYFELMIKSQLFEFFYILFDKFVEEDQDSYISKFEISDNIKIVIDYIHAHYMDTISVTQLAGLLNFSEAHFMRYFKKHVGVTCVEYINDYRVNMAAQLLAGTNQSVGDIAESIGVSNVSYFNRMFKKAFSVSPIEYRKSAGKR